MRSSELTHSQMNLWAVSAALIPTIQIAAGCTWGWAAIAALMGAFIAALVPWRGNGGRTCHILLWLVKTAALTNALYFAERFWNAGESGKWVPYILLLLSFRAACKGSTQAAEGSILLFWITGILMGSVLLAAFPEIEYKNLRPKEIKGAGKNAVSLLTVLILTKLGGRREQRNHADNALWILAGIAVMTAICAQGILSWKGMEATEEPIYKLTRSIRLNGEMRCFESILILGYLLGQYQWMGYLFCINPGEGEVKIAENVLSGIGAILISILGYRINTYMLLCLIVISYIAVQKRKGRDV